MHESVVSRAVCVVALLAAITDASALGFGRMRSAPVLGQPLQLAIPVRLDDGEELGTGCVTAEVLSGEQRVPPDAVRVRVEAVGGERMIRLDTLTAIDEPIVTITLAAGCPPRLTQRIVAFVDPPGMGAPVLAEAPAPVPAAVPPALRAALQRPPRGVDPAPPRVSAAASAAAPPAVRQERPRRAPPTADSRRRSEAPRLRLEEPEAPALSIAAAASAAADTEAQLAAARAAASSAQATAQAADQRMKAVEAEVAALRKEAQANRDAMLQMRGRLAQDDLAARVLPWLVGLALLLAVLALWLGLRVRRLGREQGMWYRDQPAAADGRDVDSEMAPLGGRTTEQAVFDMGARASHTGSATRPPAVLPVPDTAPVSLQAAGPEPVLREAIRRDVTVEEQIDLEQQADFFIVLGQDDAATDLLLTHLRGTGGATPMPYLKLLEIYRRRNDQDAYERTRFRFNQRFNGVAPQWGSDLTAGRTLEDYPAVMARLQQAWWSPIDAMAELESLLFRKGADAELFELPAYQEVLFLHQLARDLHEHQRAKQEVPDTAVDVLLPLADSDVGDLGMSVRHVDIETTQVLHPRPERPTEAPLDLDLDLSELTSPGSSPPATDAPAPQAGELRLASGFLEFEDPPPKPKPR